MIEGCGLATDVQLAELETKHDSVYFSKVSVLYLLLGLDHNSGIMLSLLLATGDLQLSIISCRMYN